MSIQKAVQGEARATSLFEHAALRPEHTPVARSGQV